MGVSFKVARTGSRYSPRGAAQVETVGNSAGSVADERGETPEEARRGGESQRSNMEAPEDVFFGVGNGTNSAGLGDARNEHVASFSLNLFPAGFSIGKPYEGMLSPLLQDVPEPLHPYDKASMTLFTAIECGLLPGDALDDIPCNYLNGAIVCEVWDYRNYVSNLEVVDSPRDFPVFQKACLHMCMENVVKDMSLISDDSWTYKDMLEAESHITKTLQPILFLDPKPSMERLCRTPVKKLHLEISHRRSMEERQDVKMNDFKSTDLVRGREILHGLVFGHSRSQTCAVPIDGAISCSQIAISRGTANMEQSGVENNVSTCASRTSSQAISSIEPYNTMSVSKTVAIVSNSVSAFNQDSRDSNVHLKKRERVNSKCPQNHMLKRPKQEQPALETQQLIMNKTVNLSEHDLQVMSPLLQKVKAEKVKHTNFSNQRHPQMKMSELVCETMPKLAYEMPTCLDTKGGDCRVKEEYLETAILHVPQVERDKEYDTMVVGIEKANQLPSLSFMRSHLPPHMQWSNPIPSVEKNTKMDDSSQKRKSSQVSWVSARGQVSSGLSSKLNEPSSISLRTPCRICPMGEAGELQKENTASAPARTVAASGIFEHKESLLKENLRSLPTKRKVNFLKASSRTKSIGSSSGVSGSNYRISTLTSTSERLTTLPCDPAFLERFSRIALLSQRYRLNYKKHKEDQYFKKRLFLHSPHALVDALESVNADESRNCFDQMCTSKYHIGWNSNLYISRVLNFSFSKFLCARTDIPSISSKKLVLSESKQPHLHLVEAQIIFGDDESMHFALLPNTHHADVFAAQFISLMERDGYELVDDQFQLFTSSNFNSSGGPSASHSSQFPLPCLAVNNVAPVCNRMSTWKDQWFPYPKILSPAWLLPHAYKLCRPRKLDIADTIGFMDPAWKSFAANKSPLHGGHKQVDSEMHNGPASLQSLQLHTLQQQKYQRHDIMKCKVAGLEALTDVLGTGGCVSDMNSLSRINGSLSQISGLNYSNKQFPAGGLSQVQLAILTNLRRESCREQCHIKISSDMAVGMSADEFPSGPSPSTSLRDHLHHKGTFSAILPEISSSNFGTNNNELSQQPKIQLPHQHVHSPMGTQLSRSKQKKSSATELKSGTETG